MYHFICRHRNDGLYDFVLFVRCYKQEISERAVQHRKFWCFNVPVVYFNLLFLLLFGTFWRTLGTSRTPDQKFALIGEPHYSNRFSLACSSQVRTMVTGFVRVRSLSFVPAAPASYNKIELRLPTHL